MQEERKLFCGLSICPDNAMLLWPIVGVVFTVSLSVLYNELLWGRAVGTSCRLSDPGWGGNPRGISFRLVVPPLSVLS